MIKEALAHWEAVVPNKKNVQSVAMSLVTIFLLFNAARQGIFAPPWILHDGK